MLVEAEGQSLTVVLNDTAAPKRGENIALSIRPDRVYLFDSVTGEQLAQSA